jgi:16S rRNA (uracil1498-N3)-methyltransferase
MRVPRLYTPQALSANSEVLLVDDAAHYIAKVLRLRPESYLKLFNGNDGEYSARIVAIDKKAVTAALEERLESNADSSLAIHLGLGLSRGERMDYAIQKATEAGVTSITPLLTERCEVKLKGDRIDNRMSHWERVAISACEQSGRCTVPTIANPLTLSEWVLAPRSGASFVLDHRGENGFPALEKPEAVTFLIGPEGGLSEEEVMLAKEKQFNLVRIGPRVLRTETAPIVAISLAQHLWGDY